MTGSEPPAAPRGLLTRLRDYPRSLAGRLALLLSVGMAASAMLALKASDELREVMFHRHQVEAAMSSAVDIARRYRRDPQDTRRSLELSLVLGAHGADQDWPMRRPDAALSRQLGGLLGHPAEVVPFSNQECFARFRRYPHAAGMNTDPLPSCWLIRYRDAAGAERRYAVDLWPDRDSLQPPVGPPYLELIVLAGALLGLIGAALATAPLRRMERAARAFSLIGDFEPIPVKGPSEVRAALETFNRAQERVREGLRERTQILASVTHDLQTPLTRLRLRLEQVEDEALRDKLIADLSITHQMVRDGLDLARSSEIRESWSVMDIDSFLSSAAEDRAEIGQQVVFTQGCAVHARIKPNALARVLDNLVDNAVKYGGGAELSCRQEHGALVMDVADRGPGLPEEDFELAFQPFRRLSSGPQSGTGIGLAIARAQAGTFGATVTLHNRAGGGLIGRIRLPAGAAPRPVGKPAQG